MACLLEENVNLSQTTDSNHNHPIASNILNRNFKVSRIRQVWVWILLI